MNKPTEAGILQASAVIVAAPRYMGAFASAIGIEILQHWPKFVDVEVASGLAMAVLEGWAIAFMFRKWRSMQVATTHWYILLGLQLLLMIMLPATTAPYLASSQLKQPVHELLSTEIWWMWNVAVAAIAVLVVAAVGYADVEQVADPKQPSVQTSAQSKKEVVEEIKEEQLENVVEDFVCNCGATFAKRQGLAAHSRHCKKIAVQLNGKSH